MWQLNIQQFHITIEQQTNNWTIEKFNNPINQPFSYSTIQWFKPTKNIATGPKKDCTLRAELGTAQPLVFLVKMAEIYFFGVINYTFQPLNILLLQYTFLVKFSRIYPESETPSLKGLRKMKLYKVFRKKSDIVIWCWKQSFVCKRETKKITINNMQNIFRKIFIHGILLYSQMKL